MLIKGHHHISLYAKDIQATLQFYRDVLGLRMFSQSVNQNNTRMYHIYFGDDIGRPGTIVTYFGLPESKPQRKGTNSIYRYSLLVPSKEALSFYKDQLTRHRIAFKDEQWMDQASVTFEDNNGAPVRLMVNENHKTPDFWQTSHYTFVPKEFQILGLGPIELHLRSLESTRTFLTQTLHFEETQFKNIFSIDKEGYYSDLVLVKNNTTSIVEPGYGYTHHLALRVENDIALKEIIQRLNRLELNHTGIVDRGFFKSLYVRQNRIMYEFATDGPGFVDETTDIETMGQTLLLPDFLEKNRAYIEEHLPPLNLN